MELQLSLGSDRHSQRRTPDAPQHVLVLGNFSASSRADARAIMARNLIPVDMYDIDAAMAGQRLSIDLSTADLTGSLTLAELDDLHPDALCRALPQLHDILNTRRRLMSPGAASDAAVSTAESLLGGAQDDQGTESAGTGDPTASEPETDQDMMSRLLGASRAPDSASKRSAAQTVERLIAEATGPASSIGGATKQRLADALDARAASMLRGVLRNERIQTIESAWRSLRWLADHLDADTECELSVFDLDILQLASIADEEPDVSDALRAHIAGQWRQRLMDEPGSLIVALDPLKDTPDSVAALDWMMGLAHELDTPLFAGADGALAGLTPPSRAHPLVDGSDIATDTDPAWSGLRSHPAARFTAVGLPRFLLRQPYGRKSDPVDAFNFEELELNPADDAFLWAGPSVALAAIWLRARAGIAPTLDDMPMVVYDDGSGQAVMPPTGCYLSESATAALAIKGFTALRAVRNSTTVTVQQIVPIGAK